MKLVHMKCVRGLYWVKEKRPLKTFLGSDLPQLLIDILHRHDLDVFVRPEHMAFSSLHDEAKHMEVT
jgi:hypothetical protein